MDNYQQDPAKKSDFAELAVRSAWLVSRSKMLRAESRTIRAESAAVRQRHPNLIFSDRNSPTAGMPLFVVFDAVPLREERGTMVRLKFRKIRNPEHLRLLLDRDSSNPL